MGHTFLATESLIFQSAAIDDFNLSHYSVFNREPVQFLQ